MKSGFFRFYFRLVTFLLKLTPTRSNHYVILNGAGRSGSNGYLFYKYLKKTHPELQVTLVEPWPSAHLSWRTWLKIGQAKYLFTTHQPFKIKKNQVSVSFWHGIPLKRMGLMAKNTGRENDWHNLKLWRRQTDWVVSSADLYETLMTACVGIEASQYLKTGFPRIDALLKPAVSQADLLKQCFGCEDSKAKVGIYMPTFRFELADQAVMATIQAGNFFAFQDFDGPQLDAALREHHQYLLIKLHPYEMKKMTLSATAYTNIHFLANDYFQKHQLDLYEILGATDFLVTDFSSIYFDYLHLNQPMIFLTNELPQYQKTRGFLIGPYSVVVPGERATTQASFIEAMSHLDQDTFEPQRRKWLQMSYEVPSQQNCARIFAQLQQG